MIVSCHSCAAASQSCDRKLGDWFQKVGYGALNSGWPSSDSTWHGYYMLGTATTLQFQVLGLWLVTLERNVLLGLGLTVTEINIKKSTEARLKTHCKTT